MTHALSPLRSTRYTFFYAAMFFSLTCTPAFAESTSTAEWNISADKVTKLENPERIIAEGDIVLIKRVKEPPFVAKAQLSEWEEMLEETPAAVQKTPDELEPQGEPTIKTAVTIKADWMSYDTTHETIEAKGHVIVDTGSDVLYAEEANVDLKKETGDMNKGKILRQDLDLHLEGKKISKTGKKTYTIEDGWVITCKLEKNQAPPWSFSSSYAEIEQGGYAVLHDAKFNIKNFPIFYSPYLVVPVKDTRQTGLLLPVPSHSTRDGFGIDVPLFINISDSADATLYTEYLSKRGVKPSLDFRYMLDDSTQGRFTIDYLKDALSDPSETGYYSDTGFTHTNDDRYWIRGKVDNTFGDDWITRLDVDIVSDKDYLNEFRSGYTGFNSSKSSYLSTFGRSFEDYGDYYRENTFSVLKTWTYSSLSTKFLAIDDLTDDGDSDALWELPSIEYSGDRAIGDSSFLFEWDADYVNYWREEGVGAQRLDLYPRVSVAIPLSAYLESSAEVGVRETMYSITTYGDADWDYDETPNRTLETFSYDIATTMVKDYNDGEKNAFRHSIRPFVEYNYITGDDYMTDDDDDDTLPDFDSVDELEDTNAITYGIDNYFYIPTFDGDYTTQKGYIKVEQSYNLDDSLTDDEFSEVTFKIGGSPIQPISFAYETNIPVADDQYSSQDFDAYIRTSRGDRLKLEYSFDNEDNTNQLNAYLSARIHPLFQLGLGVEYNIEYDTTDESYAALTFIQQCWSVKLKEEHTSTDDRIIIAFTLANLGSPFDIGL